MQKTTEDKEILTGLITCVDVQSLFNRSDQSIAIWRKEYGLPFVVIPSEGRAAVRYRLARVKQWAATSGKEMSPEFLKLLEARADGSPTSSPPVQEPPRRRRRFADIGK